MPSNTSPLKRRCHPSESPPSTRGHNPKPPPNLTWLLKAKSLRNALQTQYNALATTPFGDISVSEILYCWAEIQLVLVDLVRCTNDSTSRLVERFPDHAGQLSTFDQQTQTNDLPIATTETENWPSPSSVETEPTEVEVDATPVLKTYAQATKPHTPQLPPLPQQQHQPPHAKKPTMSKTLNPTRVIAYLHDQPELSARTLSKHKFHNRLSEAISKIPNTPSLLGVKWNQKGNLILSYPTNSSHTNIKLHFLTIQSVLKSEAKVKFCFDVPWQQIHLASIWSREDTNSPIASGELRATLRLNPTIQALNITMQASWLKKPDQITGTHTSAVIVFEDPNGLIERSLLRLTIFAFGEAITIKKWHNKPQSKTKE